MSLIASQITSLMIVYSTVYSKKTSKLRVTGLCAGNSPGTGEFPHKGPVTRKMFPFDDVIMDAQRVLIDCHTGNPFPFLYAFDTLEGIWLFYVNHSSALKCRTLLIFILKNIPISYSWYHCCLWHKWGFIIRCLIKRTRILFRNIGEYHFDCCRDACQIWEQSIGNLQAQLWCPPYFVGFYGNTSYAILKRSPKTYSCFDANSAFAVTGSIRGCRDSPLYRKWWQSWYHYRYWVLV